MPDVPVTKHPFLLSASMFYGMEYDFNTFDSKFTVYIPDNIPLKREFKLKDLDGKLYAQVDGVLLQENIEKRTYIDNYTQIEVTLDKAVSEVLEKQNIAKSDVDLDNNIMLE